MARRGRAAPDASAASLLPSVHKHPGAEDVVRAAAAGEGFALCGFARVQAPPPHAEALLAWLAADHAAGMAYIGNGVRRRLDPAVILDGVRSIITLAYPYAPPPAPIDDWRETLRGRIAAYAAGPDYHDVVLGKLDRVAGALSRLIPRSRALTYVDTGAILEREWANLGGVGWFGKNTMILHRSRGSWFLLGEILTDVELEPEPLESDHCGTCRRCLDDCPTGALKGNYVLDARLCISYLTIEHRGAIPRDMRPRIGNWIFGCDVCQEVCPWNGAPPAQQQDSELQPYLPEVLALDDDAFQRRYRRTAVWRSKREGLLRNCAVVLGNTGNPDAVPFLARSLADDPSPVVRAHAAWALGTLGGAKARSALETARNDPDESVRAEAEAVL